MYNPRGSSRIVKHEDKLRLSVKQSDDDIMDRRDCFQLDHTSHSDEAILYERVCEMEKDVTDLGLQSLLNKTRDNKVDKTNKIICMYHLPTSFKNNNQPQDLDLEKQTNEHITGRVQGRYDIYSRII